MVVEGPINGIAASVEQTWDFPGTISWFAHLPQYLGARTSLNAEAMIVRQVPACIGAQPGKVPKIILATLKGPEWQNGSGITRIFLYATN